MKIPFGFGGKKASGKRRRSYERDWDETEFEYEDVKLDDTEAEYAEEEYSEDEYGEEEYSDEEYEEDVDFEEVYAVAGYSETSESEEEYAEEAYGEDSEGEYAEEAYGDAEPEEEYSEEGYSEAADSEEEYFEESYNAAEYSEEYAEAEYSGENIENEYAEEAAVEFPVDESADGAYVGLVLPAEEFDDDGYLNERYAAEEPSETEFAENENTGIYAGLVLPPDEEVEEDFEEISYEEEEYMTDDYEEDIEEDAEESYEYEEEEDEEERKGLLFFTGNSEIIDKLVMFGSIAVALVVLIVGGIFVGSKLLTPKEDNALQEVGLQLAQIDTIGGDGLLAVSDAQKAAIEAAKIAEEEKEKAEEEETEYEETEYKTEVTVKLSLASIEKDLKIKFINKDTGKLVGNVPFAITITDPDGKESLWSDDDMDGIIYKKNLTAGQYKIAVNAFEDVKYKKYGLPAEQQKVTVKAKIEYNKVDVANEVKTESQVNVQKEDTKKNETVVESYLTDTVTWVESTATLVSYSEIDKSVIVNPMQLALHTGFTRLAASGSTVSGGDMASPGPSPSVSPIPSPSVSPSPSPSVSPSPSPSVSPSPSPSVSPSPSPSVSPSPSPTATPKPMVLTLDKKTAAVYVDYPDTVTVSVENLMEKAVITAESSDTNVATVQVDDNTITVTGVAAGTATITVNCSAEVKVTVQSADGKGTTETTQIYKAEPVVCSVTVKANPEKDTVTVLKDNQGREVYVKDGETYRVAYYADYYTYSKFYVKGQAKYTGWQTLDGNRYFYDASGKKVTGEQVIQGVKYNFASDGSLVTGSGTLGIDVSKWNGNIDWNAVKNSGVSYVIIRCGYRGSSQGALIQDSKFESNIKGAINAGLKVGVYFFTQAIDKNEAIEEASMVLDCIKNYTISYPIFLDVEPSGGRADSLDAATRTEICKTFCETIQNYGYTAGIYANKTWLNEKINTSELSSSYKIWLAQYAAEPTYAGRYDMWQYKSTGKIDGISGDVDMNLSYLGY